MRDSLEPKTQDSQLRSQHSRETGEIGEELAAEYLARQGCIILARRWRAKPGEIDIVARCPLTGARGQDAGSGVLYDPGNDMLVFVEVRTRHGALGRAEESVSRHKAAGMASAALQYMEAHGLDTDITPWRIDVVAVAISGDGLASVNWIQGAIGEEALG